MSILISAWAIAAVVHFVGGIVYLRPDVSFRHVLSIVSHSLIPVSLMQAIMFAIRYATWSLDTRPTLASLYRNIPWDAGGQLTSNIADFNLIVVSWLGFLAAGVAAAYNQKRWWPLAASLWALYAVGSFGLTFVESMPVLGDVLRHGPRT
jgi:hypothetical protein